MVKYEFFSYLTTLSRYKNTSTELRVFIDHQLLMINKHSQLTNVNIDVQGIFTDKDLMWVKVKELNESHGSGFRVQGSGFRVQGLGFRV